MSGEAEPTDLGEHIRKLSPHLGTGWSLGKSLGHKVLHDSVSYLHQVKESMLLMPMTLSLIHI